MEEIYDIKESILNIVNNRSWIQKTFGLFSLINTFWLWSIIGMVVTIVPCMYSIFGKLLLRLAEAILKFAKTIAIWIGKNILLPICNFCHNWGIFELLGYIICF